jgi:hypothetical protein
MQGKAAYIRHKVVGSFSRPCSSGSYMHRTTLFIPIEVYNVLLSSIWPDGLLSAHNSALHNNELNFVVYALLWYPLIFSLKMRQLAHFIASTNVDMMNLRSFSWPRLIFVPSLIHVWGASNYNASCWCILCHTLLLEASSDRVCMLSFIS